MKFCSFKEKYLVLTRGPYTIQNMPMILKEWTLDFNPDFNFKRDMVCIILVWVKLPNLPLYLWGAKCLGKIDCALGNPLFTDECTAQKLRVSYAHILIEIDVTRNIIKDNEGIKIVSVWNLMEAQIL